MKNFSRTLVALAGVALLAQGCNKANDPVVNVKNGNPVGQPKVTYVIQVVSASGNTEGRTSGLPSATISYRNAAGAIKTSNVSDAAGNIVISDVAPGAFSGHFSLDGYAPLDFTTDLNPGTNSLADSGKAYVAATRLYAIRSNAALEGRIYGNYAGTNQPVVNPALPNNQAAVGVRVSYSLTNAYPKGSGTGRITDISLDIVNPTSTTTEATGKFTFADLPTTSSGYVTATLSMTPYDVVRADVNTNFVLQNNNSLSLDLPSAANTKLGDLLAVRR